MECLGFVHAQKAEDACDSFSCIRAFCSDSWRRVEGTQRKRCREVFVVFSPLCRVRVVRFDQSSSPPPPPVLLLLRGSTGASGHRTGWSTLLRWTSNLVKWKGASERFWSCRLLINKPSHLDVKLMFCCLITIMSTPD